MAATTADPRTWPQEEVPEDGGVEDGLFMRYRLKDKYNYSSAIAK